MPSQIKATFIAASHLDPNWLETDGPHEIHMSSVPTDGDAITFNLNATEPVRYRVVKVEREVVVYPKQGGAEVKPAEVTFVRCGEEPR